MKIASRKVHYFPFPTRFLPWKRGFTERLRGAPRSPVVRSRASLVGARDRCLCLWGRGVSSLPFLCLSTLQPSFSARPVVCLPQSPTEPMAGVPFTLPLTLKSPPHSASRPSVSQTNFSGQIDLLGWGAVGKRQQMPAVLQEGVLMLHRGLASPRAEQVGHSPETPWAPCTGEAASKPRRQQSPLEEAGWLQLHAAHKAL